MTLPSAIPVPGKPERADDESRPANDNHPPEPDGMPILDLPCDHEDVADIARRAERLGNAVVIAMALCLLAAPALYVVWTYTL